MTASEMFSVPLDQMTPDIRRQAKAINFGVIYGISGFGLARNLRIPRAEAQGFIDRYFERFPGIRAYMDDTIAFAKREGYVQTLFGRKIHTPEINAKGPTAGFARRAAINAPIQGAAADVIRRAMIRMPAAIAGLPAKMLLQVHDELLFEVEEGAVDADHRPGQGGDGGRGGAGGASGRAAGGRCRAWARTGPRRIERSAAWLRFVRPRRPGRCRGLGPCHGPHAGRGGDSHPAPPAECRERRGAIRAGARSSQRPAGRP